LEVFESDTARRVEAGVVMLGPLLKDFGVAAAVAGVLTELLVDSGKRWRSRSRVRGSGDGGRS